MRKVLLGMLLIMMTLTAFAESWQPLKNEQAFQFSAHLDKKRQLILEWQIAPGYYLYRSKFKFIPGPQNQVQLGIPIFPHGEYKHDSIHGTYQIYSKSLQVELPVIKSKASQLDLEVHYQGCSAKGYCYLPVKKHLTVDLAKAAPMKPFLLQKLVKTPSDNLSGTKYTDELLMGGNKFLLILGFFGLGLLLAFTPCVLPMIPILSSIIIGHKKITTLQSFLLSLVYVLGMALTYAAAGIVIALLGSSIQAAMQKTWVIVLFSLLFAALAFWLLDFYTMHLPAHWQKRITRWNQQQKSGTYLGVFLMGVFSTLIVSPCVSAPLVGVLAYIGQTGDALFGGTALLAMGFGMGVPLLLIGISAGKFLPKAGAWMVAVQRIVALIMLGMAIWMLSRVINPAFVLFLWGLLLVFTAFLLGLFGRSYNGREVFQRGLGLVILTYGMILMMGALMGNTDPLRPWEGWGIKAVHTKPAFVTIQSMEQLQQQFEAAKHARKIILVDFYADWCSSCVLMDKQVFAQNNVQQALANVVLLRADITKNNDFDHGLLKYFHVIAAPTILFFDFDGKELSEQRIVGEVNAKQFLDHLEKIQNQRDKY